MSVNLVGLCVRSMAVALVLAVSPGLAHAQSLEERERAGRAFFDQERYAEAAEQFRAILGAEPGHRTANILLAFSLARLGNAGAAVEQARRALDLFPGNVRLQLVLAGFLSQQEPTRQEAIQRYRWVLQQEPQNMLARLGLAEIARTQGRSIEAIEGFAALGKQAPEDPRYQVRLGQLYGGLGDLEQAQLHFERAYGMAPTNVDTLRSLAILADVGDRPLEAAALYRTLLGLLPADVSAQIGLRLVEEAAGEPAFPIPLEEMQKRPLDAYLKAMPEHSRQLEHRRDQIAATERRSLARFLPSFFFNPSRSTIERTPDRAVTDRTEAYSFSFGWNLGDLVADPWAINLSSMRADFESVRANLAADVNGTYYQRLQNILQYRHLRRALALDSQNAQVRQNKLSLKYAILALTERLKILTGMP
jgi:tetratricopeptide (TPR) repeat protein